MDKNDTVIDDTPYGLPELLVSTNWSICEQWQVSHAEQLESKVCYLIAFGIALAIINIVTNMFALYVFTLDRTGGVLSDLLKTLSVYEVSFQAFFLAYLTCRLLLYSGNLVFHSTTAMTAFVYMFSFCVIPGITAFHVARNWIVVIISAFRFEAVCRAFDQRCLLFKGMNTLMICVAVGISSLVIALPRGLERNFHFCQRDGVIIISGIGYRLMDNYYFKTYYFVVGLFLFQTGGPTVLVCILSTFTVLKLSHQRKIKNRLLRRNDNHSSTASGKGRITSSGTVERRSPLTSADTLVILLCVIFFLCEMPAFFSKIVASVGGETDQTEALAEAANIVTQIDTLCNVFIYAMSSRHFRDTTVALITKRQAPPTAYRAGIGMTTVAVAEASDNGNTCLLEGEELARNKQRPHTDVVRPSVVATEM